MGQFIYPSPTGHLGCFQVLAIMSKAALTILVHVFVWTWFFVSFEWLARGTITGSMMRLCLVLYGTAKLSSRGLALSVPPAAGSERCRCSPSWPGFCMFGRSDRCAVVPHCGLICISLRQMMRFHALIRQRMFSLVKSPIRSHCQTPAHLDFLLCYRLRVPWFYVLHVGLGPILI